MTGQMRRASVLRLRKVQSAISTPQTQVIKPRVLSPSVLRRRASAMALSSPNPMASFVADASKPLVSTNCQGILAVPDAIDLVFYHGGGCIDGFAAAFAAWLKLGDRAQFVPCEHGTATATFPDVKGRHIAVVDFCFKPDVTHRMIREAASFVVLDHHASAQGDLAEVDGAYKVFEMAQSGATLSWDFFNRGVPAPPLLRYVEDKDLWRWALRSSAEVTAALGTVPHSFPVWAELVSRGEAGIEELMAKGAAILKYKNSVVEAHVQRAQPCRLASAPGFQGMVVNASTVASEIGNALATLPGVDFGLMWSYEHASKTYRVSLRSASDAVDVSIMAKAFGGGGHRRASGFTFAGSSIQELLVGDAPMLPEREQGLQTVMSGIGQYTLAAGVGGSAAPQSR